MMGQLAAVIAALVGYLALQRFFRWFRNRSPQARERMAAKMAMPAWLKLAEMTIWVSLWTALGAAAIAGAFALHRLWHPGPAQPSGPAGFLLAIPCLAATLAPAMLLSNLASWFIPPMRRANEAAMRGRPAASFRQSAIDLTRFGAILLALCLIAVAAGVADPWLK